MRLPRFTDLCAAVAVVAMFYIKTILHSDCTNRMEHHRNSPSTEGFITDRNDQLINRDEVLVLGTEPSRKVMLAIGIPTVVREYNSVRKIYVIDTIHGLLDQLNDVELEQIKIIVFVSDLIEEKRQLLIDMIKLEFSRFIDLGVIDVIKAPPRYYRQLHNLPRNFGDKEAKVVWRSKQNLDYAFLMKYASLNGYYYMQLEDDVAAHKGYLTVIQQTILQAAYKEINWVTISFSDLGYIAKLYEQNAVNTIADTLMTFYYEMPCDWIVPHVFHRYGVTIVTGFNLFDHMGAQSSSAGTT